MSGLHNAWSWSLSCYTLVHGEYFPRVCVNDLEQRRKRKTNSFERQLFVIKLAEITWLLIFITSLEAYSGTVSSWSLWRESEAHWKWVWELQICDVGGSCVGIGNSVEAHPVWREDALRMMILPFIHGVMWALIKIRGIFCSVGLICTFVMDTQIISKDIPNKILLFLVCFVFFLPQNELIFGASGFGSVHGQSEEAKLIV